MSHTSTHTYTVVEFANPYLICDQCGRPVRGYRQSPSEDDDGLLVPCGHLGVTSTCPSWGPVDGCRCGPPCPLPDSDRGAS